MNEVVKDVEGVLAPDEAGCLTNEDSLLYAGVQGSKGLFVSLGGSEEVVKNDGAARSKLVVEDDASSETDLHGSCVWCMEGCDRTPIVEGSTISSTS